MFATSSAINFILLYTYCPSEFHHYSSLSTLYIPFLSQLHLIYNILNMCAMNAYDDLPPLSLAVLGSPIQTIYSSKKLMRIQSC